MPYTCVIQNDIKFWKYILTYEIKQQRAEGGCDRPEEDVLSSIAPDPTSF